MGVRVIATWRSKQGTYPEALAFLEASLGASMPIDNGYQATTGNMAWQGTADLSVKPKLLYAERNPGQPKWCMPMRRIKIGCYRRELMNSKYGLKTVRVWSWFRYFVLSLCGVLPDCHHDGWDLQVNENMCIFECWKGSPVNGPHSHAILYFLSPISYLSHICRDQFQEGVV